MAIVRKNFTPELIEKVWQKGTPIPGRDSNFVRKDRCGAIIRRLSYGTLGECGWEIDHIIPLARHGSDDLTNLRPLHWKNNKAKGDNPDGFWSCAVR